MVEISTSISMLSDLVDGIVGLAYVASDSSVAHQPVQTPGFEHLKARVHRRIIGRL